MQDHSINLRRRQVIAGVGAGAALSLAGCAATGGAPMGRVLVVGGGYGGATAAKYLRKWSEGRIEVVMVERQPNFISCPLSNLVLGGSRKIEDLTISYDGLRKLGVNVMQDEVLSIDAAGKKAKTKSGQELGFDRVVVAPGIDFNFNAIQGYNAQAQQSVLHAWKAGDQTVALRKQLEAMPDGGVYVLTIPTAPYRCPPGPYERACQVASYFKKHKPKSKVLILDANQAIVSKPALFSKYFKELYGGIIEYRPNSNVTELDLGGKAVVTEVGDRVKGDVINIVPMQQAADLAKSVGLVNMNNRWCGVDWQSMESTAVKGVHVLGDSTFPAPAMPKSGHMANQHGKTAAAAIVELMSGRPAPATPMMANTCYSFIDDENVVHVASVHRYDAAQKTMVTVQGSGGVSSAMSELEGKYGHAWARNIWADALA